MSLLSFLGIGGDDAGRWDSDFWFRPIGAKTSAGMVVTDDIANTYSAVWAATQLLTAAGSSLPLDVKRRVNADTKETDRDHAVHVALHYSPNPEMGSMGFRSLMLDWQINQGNAYAEIAWSDDGGEVHLWPIHPSRVKAKRTKDGEMYYEVKNDGEEKPTILLPEEMLHIRGIKSKDGISGVGVIQNARESIGFGLAVERQGADYFANAGRPSVVISGGKFEDEKAKKFYRQTWAEKHTGIGNNGKPMMLPPEATITTMQFNAEDSQFLETREHNVEVIARWYGVPPHMIGDLRRATFSNIEHLGISFVVYSLLPWLKLWEEEIGRKLLWPESRDLSAKHNANALLRGDTAGRAAFYTALFNIGVLSPNDIRKREDMNPFAEGDKRFVPLAMGELGAIGNDGDAENVINKKAAEELVSYMEDMTIDTVREGYDRIAELVARTKAETSPARPLKRGESELESETKIANDWFKHELGRLGRAESKDVLRAAEKQSNFVAWMDKYYASFEGKLSSAIEKPCDAMNGTGYSKDYAQLFVKNSRRQLLEATDGDPTSRLWRLIHSDDRRQPLQRSERINAS